MIELTQYLGKPCRHGHVNEDGLTIRSRNNNSCLECNRLQMQKLRAKKGEAYKEYQAAYHKKQREQEAEKLHLYRQTQVERGHCYVKVKDRDTFVAPPEAFIKKDYDAILKGKDSD